MRIAKHAEMLEIKNDRGTLYPVLAWDDKDVVLFDTGLDGQVDLFRDTVSQAGFTLEQITKVILTHQDTDHVGCAKKFAEMGAAILAHEVEAPYINGEKTPVKIAAKEERLSGHTEEQRAHIEQLKANALRLSVPVNQTLRDGETLGVCGGVKVIHTPGHTPGHVALLLTESNLLIAGDNAHIMEGALTGANPEYTQDMEQANHSFQKMMAAYPSAVVCYHSGLYRVDDEQ